MARFGILKSLHQLETGSQVLDYGAGTGRLTPLLLNKRFRVTNLEPTSSRVLVRNRVGESQFNELLLVSDSRHLQSNSFDAVFSIGVIHHVLNPRDLLADMLKLCKDDGLISLWVYRRQNAFLQALIDGLRLILRRAPHLLLLLFSTIFAATLYLLRFFSQRRSLGLGEYTFRNLNLMIYDQLSPPLSVYYRTAELIALVKSLGVEFTITEVGSGINITMKKSSL